MASTGNARRHSSLNQMLTARLSVDRLRQSPFCPVPQDSPSAPGKLWLGFPPSRTPTRHRCAISVEMRHWCGAGQPRSHLNDREHLSQCASSYSSTHIEQHPTSSSPASSAFRSSITSLLCRLPWQVVESELLAKSLLDEGPDGLTQRILTKAGVDVSRFSTELDSFL